MFRIQSIEIKRGRVKSEEIITKVFINTGKAFYLRNGEELGWKINKLMYFVMNFLQCLPMW